MNPNLFSTCFCKRRYASPLGIRQAAAVTCRRLAREESGAVFVVTLGIFLFMWVVCCGVYAIGENVRRKIEIQNAADAAAYSAAAVQADFLSRVATVNRAMAWTYVQMTRRQMDCITKKWMEKTLERIKGDRARMKILHRSSCTGNCNYLPPHPSPWPSRGTFWCGLDGQDGVFSINTGFPSKRISEDEAKAYVSSVSGAEKARNRQSGSSAGWSFEQQIAADKSNISAMNTALRAMMQEYSVKVKDTVYEVVRSNLPADRLGEFTYTCVNEQASGWFDVLRNTKMGERRFLMFAGDYAGKSASQIFNEGVISGKKAGGVNHWFVRAQNESQGIPEPASGQGTEGICRSYRKLNEQMKPHVAANCQNHDIDGDSAPQNSVALVSEWHHNAWAWNCVTMNGACVHTKMASVGTLCAWYSPSPIITSRKNCISPVRGSSDGGGRVYGDDPELVSQLRWDRVYAGERCKPVVLSASTSGFFGRGGAILVGVARKATNPWEEVLTKIEGMFKAFDAAQGVTHLWAVSAARAGYKEWNDNETLGYQLGYTPDDGSNFEYCWNLRQTDWDAHFLPVKHAWEFCQGTRGGTPSFTPAGAGAPLASVMTGTWQPLGGGTHPSWGAPAAPRGMSGTLDWGGLNASVRH